MSFYPNFYRCGHCGQVISVLKDAGVSLHCCGEEMKHLQANTVEASTEKHLPVATLTPDELEVRVGSVPHPMEPGHFIEWVYVHMENGGQRRILANPGEALAKFCTKHGKPLEVYAYCNLHGLWKVVL